MAGDWILDPGGPVIERWTRRPDGRYDYTVEDVSGRIIDGPAMVPFVPFRPVLLPSEPGGFDATSPTFGAAKQVRRN